MKLVLAEKPSVAQSIAKVLGAAKREDGYLEGNGYVVSWCVGHLVELAQPEAYDAKYSKWAYADPGWRSCYAPILVMAVMRKAECKEKTEKPPVLDPVSRQLVGKSQFRLRLLHKEISFVG